MTEKRRRKTGCLTCRTRKVKCDERKPECERCEAANVECAGYAEKRRVKTRLECPEQRASTVEVLNSNVPFPTTPSQHQYTQPRFREDGLPLMALPVNPNPFQRPHSRARDMLGYHQYLYRTLDILFAPKSLHFWRDYLCEAAWETEWVFDAIVALGSMHRATLLLSKNSSSDRDRGLDTKIVAIQIYIRALEGVSRDINENKRATPLAVGVLILMAYIECFSGNIPAAIRHTQVAQYYSYSMVPHDGHPASQFVLPIESSLRDLELICRIVRPFPSPLEPRSLSNAEKLTVNLPSSFFDLVASSPSIMIQQLLEFTSADLDLKHLVWCLYAAHYKTVSREKVLAFLQALDDWKTYNSTNFQTLKVEDSPSDSSEFSYKALESLPFPPLPNEQTSWEICLALALYSFYKARLLWALCLLGDPSRMIELDCYFHVYELLRHTRTAWTISPKSFSNPMIPCENLRIGFSPLLYLAGRCCPSPQWVSWIIQELGNVGQEGLFHNKPFATTLEILLSLEKSRTEISNSRSPSDRMDFVPPSSRIIAVFIPHIDGRSFESFYSRPSVISSDTSVHFNIFQVARWSDTSGTPEPAIEDYEASDQPFSQEWLLERPIVQKWLDWSCAKEFDLDQVINDHIIGNRLLLEMG